MEAASVKEVYEHIKKLLDDPKAFGNLLDKAYITVQKAKEGAFDLAELEKELNEIASKSGSKKTLSREAVEKMFNDLNNDKVKSASKDELAKLMRESLEEKKAKIEAGMKK